MQYVFIEQHRRAAVVFRQNHLTPNVEQKKWHVKWFLRHPA